jgi:hypothetical protein
MVLRIMRVESMPQTRISMFCFFFFLLQIEILANLFNLVQLFEDYGVTPVVYIVTDLSHGVGDDGNKARKRSEASVLNGENEIASSMITGIIRY